MLTEKNVISKLFNVYSQKKEENNLKYFEGLFSHNVIQGQIILS